MNFVRAIHVLSVVAEDSRSAKFERFWEVEDCESADDVKESSQLEAFKKEIEFDGECYSVPLPFIPEMKEVIPLNYRQTERRLTSMTVQLKADREKFRRYDDVIRKQEAEGKVEKVTDYPPEGKAHYLPHHCIVKEDKETTKFRVVYDASSGKPSLNDCLEKGENLVPLMFDVLMRCRAYKVALIGDIKEAFLNVGVKEEYRDFLRFLWYENIDDPVLIPVIYRFTRVIFGVNASLWLLMAVIHNHLEQHKQADPEFVAQVLRSLFVDDNVGGADNPTDAFLMYQKLKNVFHEAG